MLDTEKGPLTSAEITTLWSTYVSNSIAICVLKYFLAKAEDSEAKSVLAFALNSSTKQGYYLKSYFMPKMVHIS